MSRGIWANDPRALQRASRHGAIKVAALTELGMPPRTAYRRCLPGGPWQRLLPGVVLLGNSEPTGRQLVEAALLYAGPNAVVTGAESCRRHGLRNVPDDRHMHLLVPHERKVHSSNYVIIERTTRFPKPMVRDDVPLAPLVRSVLDTCRRLRAHAPIRALISEAVQRGHVRPGSLEHELEAGSQRGTALPREALKDVTAGAWSIAEIDAMRLWSRTALPRPAWNVPLHRSDGVYVATPDAWFDDVGLAWEIDSYEFHFQRTDYANTISRNARYAAAGVIVLQTLPNRLRNEPEAVAAELVAAYRAAANRPRPAVHTRTRRAS